MNVFEFVFSLFGLLLGLSLAEILGGFARATQARRKVRLGWLTPLLGLWLIIDLVSFWGLAWGMRELLTVTLDSMLFISLIAGIYYVAASLVFPHDWDEWTDLDAYFMAHKKMVVGAVLACNLLILSGQALLGTVPFVWFVFVPVAIITALLLALMYTSSKRISLILLCIAISGYWVSRLVQ